MTMETEIVELGRFEFEIKQMEIATTVNSHYNEPLYNEFIWQTSL